MHQVFCGSLSSKFVRRPDPKGTPPEPNAYLTWAECSDGSCNEKELDVNCKEVGGLDNH